MSQILIPAQTTFVARRAALTLTAPPGAAVTIAGTLQAISGSLTVNFAVDGLMGGNTQTLINTGRIEAAPGGVVTLHGQRAYLTNYGTVANSGTIIAQGGTVDIQANLHQTGAGTVAITMGGTVLLEGAADGGTIQITQGTLAFGQYSRVGGIANAAAGTTSRIAFLHAPAGAVQQIAFGPGAQISEVFNAAKQELIVSAKLTPTATMQVADLHLTGGVYRAADFSVHGNNVVFLSH